MDGQACPRTEGWRIPVRAPYHRMDSGAGASFRSLTRSRSPRTHCLRYADMHVRVAWRVPSDGGGKRMHYHPSLSALSEPRWYRIAPLRNPSTSRAASDAPDACRPTRHASFPPRIALC